MHTLVNKKTLIRKIKFLKDPILNYFFKKNHQIVNQYAKFYEQLQVEKNTILYESRDGNSMTDSPYAMFKYMLENPEFKDFVHIWSVSDFDLLSSVISEYKDFPNVKFVQRNSKSYLKYLASCEYFINNSTFQPFFIPKKDQTYINTWHGTPLKNMGFDIPGNPSQSQNVVRNFLSADYLLSPNAHTTKMFTDSYKLDGIYAGTIIEEGYPRIDLTLNADPKQVNAYLQGLGLKINSEKQNILYAPTWKGTNVSKANNDVLQIVEDMNYLEQQIGDQYNILIKVHPFLYPEAAKNQQIKTKLVPDFVDTNELLAAVDILITDYSSIFFDYLVTNKPILYYTWDLDDYSENRGQYLKNEELPGPFVYNAKELAEAVRNIQTIQTEYHEKYKKMQQQFTNHEDGKVTARVVQYIFQKSSQKLKVFSGLNTRKQKILIYPGGMKNNGITSSFINLMNNIDFDQYDISCFTATPKAQEVFNNIQKVNQNARFLFKPGLPVYNLFEIYKDKFVHNRGERGFFGKKLFPETAYVREHARLFGKSKFDYCIDFSGYSLFWAKYLVVADVKKKICFMHNDLLSDSEREINGKRPHRVNLRGLFSIYHRFDKLVSVSEGTMELNKKNLLEYADSEKFDYVLNSINPEKILGENQQETEEMENSLSTINFKSSGVIKDIESYLVWNTLPGNLNAGQFTLGKEFANAEVLVTREAELADGIYYKFSYNNQVIGWINSKAVELKPDRIFYEKTVNELAKLIHPKGNNIWSKPYDIVENTKVSGSHDYKNVIVELDKEAQTEHGIYNRLIIDDTVIGWIDRSALSIYQDCTITPDMGANDRLKAKWKRKLIQMVLQKKDFVKQIGNRTLEEINLDEPMFAKITRPKGQFIWSKAFPNYKTKQVDEAKSFAGEIVTITTICKTKEGTYYLVYLEDQKIGWLAANALDLITEPTVIRKTQVSMTAVLHLAEEDSIWSKPIGLTGAEKTQLTEDVNGSMVDINEEVTTQKGTCNQIMKDGHVLGWVDKKALVIKEVKGLIVNNRLIPDPSKEDLNFVNMGRLSPEKAQDNLIRAFGQFHENYPNSKLFILGAGPLKDDLLDLIAQLDLHDSVHLLGQLENPFIFLKKCDCFVLSSHYEGQPMVLLEAMTLGMKIMATDIVANRTVLEDGKYGLLVENSISGLEQGLTTIATNKDLQFKKFDYQEYNTLAMGTFYKCLQK